jgi:hypothetical protein
MKYNFKNNISYIIMDPNNIVKTKRLSKDTNYVRPKKTVQDTMSNDEIKEKLQGYKKVDDIKKVLIGSHLRYFAKAKNSKTPIFRLGGFLTKFGDDYKYVVLSNGEFSWSVQLNGTNEFWAKMNQKEFQEKIETEVEEKFKQAQPNEETEKYKERYKQVKSQNDYIIKLLEEQKKENDKLAAKLKAIENAAKKDKSKK